MNADSSASDASDARWGGGKRMKEEFLRYPKYKENYIRAFDRMIARRAERGLPIVHKSGEECFTWWVGDNPNQIAFDFGEDEQC